MKSALKRLCNKVISIALAIVMVLSVPQTALASYEAGDWNGAGGGEIGGTSDPESVSVIHLFHENQGFRVYLVNKQGICVTKLVDFVKYRPWDLKALYGQSTENLQSYIEKYFKQTGLWQNPGGDTWKRINYLGGVKTDPMYCWSAIGKNPLKPDKISMIYKNGMNPLSNPMDSHNGILTNMRKNYTGSNVNADIRYEPNGKMYTIADLENYLNQAMKDNYTKHELILDGSNATIDSTVSQQPAKILKKVPAAIEDFNGNLAWTGDYMRNLMLYDPDQNGNILLKLFVYLQMPAVDSLGNVVNNADGVYQIKDLFEFIDPNLQAAYKKNLEAYSKLSEAERKSAKNPMVQTMVDNDLKLAFEPISWGVPTVVSNLPLYVNNRWNYFWADDAIAYGTPKNVVQYTIWSLQNYLNSPEVSKNLPDLDLLKNDYFGYLKKYNFQIGWQWGLPQRAYYLNKDEPKYGLKAYPYGNQEQNSLSYLASTMSKDGWGVMFFSPEAPIQVNTPTWDSIQFPEDNYKPGVTPSMDHIKTEGSDYQQAVYPDGKKKDHNFSITKFYCRENPDGTYTYQSNYTRTNTLHTITLNDEPGYKVGSYFTSPELKLPDTADTSYDDYKATLPKGDFTGNSAGNITVPASSNDRALYMKLVSTKPVDEPDTVPIPLWEYEISKQIPERAITVESHRKVTNTLPALPNDVYESDYKAQYKPEGKNGWKNWYNYTNPGIDNAPTNLIAVPVPFEKSYTGLNSGYKVPSRGHTKEVTNTMDSKFCIWRGMDMPTLASYKAEDTANNKSELKTLGLPEGKTPQSTRGETNQPTDISGIIENKLTSQFILNEADSNTAVSSEERTRYREEYEDDEGHTHHRWGSWSAWSHYSTEQGTKNNPTLQDYNIRVHYYLGKENSGIEQAKDLKEINEGILTRNLDGTDENRIFTGRGTAIPTKEAIKLYPYSKMVYNTSHDTTFKPAYTLSQYESTIHNTDYVDMVFSKQYRNSLALNSDQWSTHARSINGIGPNVVLPGGALNTLSTPIKNNTCVAVKVYQTVTPDSMEPALTSGYDYYNPASAKARRDNLINQVQSSLDGLNVVQYVQRGITDDVFDILSNGIKLDSNGGQQVYNNVTSTDDKYYYKKGLTAANGAKINMLKSDDINEKVYSISSFTDGTVEIKRDGGLIMKLEKKEGIDKINSAQELRELDIRTKFFTNFLTAIDRNAGSKGWYNEAIDSMELHVYTQIFTLGFAKPFDVRTSVLDPKLVGYQESKSDLYNFTDPSKVRSSVYLTEYDGLRDTGGWPILATWGDENNQITMQNVPLLFQSKVFYIPNATVMDTY